MRKTALQMWLEANERIELIGTEDLAEELELGEALVLDVRLPVEVDRRGTIPGALRVPRQVIEWWADPESPYFRENGVFGDFERRVITFCDGGGNGALAAATLQDLGYSDVATLEGGFHSWAADDMEILATDS